MLTGEYGANKRYQHLIIRQIKPNTCQPLWTKCKRCN